MPKKTATPPAGPWLPPTTASQDGSVILADFGYPYPQAAAWNSCDEKWNIANIQGQTMQDHTLDVWFENEQEPHASLKKWMPLPVL